MSFSGPPSWVKDAIFYQIFPDRFARSGRVAKPDNLEPWDSPPSVSGYKGGDLLGVAERLDWLAELGVNALYFTPVFQSAANHRYHTHDYYRVDPMLGGDPALRELIDSAHERGMRVVLDGVFNHASRGFFQFSDILENGPKSAYTDWFHIRRYPLNAYQEGPLGYDAWWNLPALPKFNTDTPAVREFLWGVGRYWLEMGIDGWRLDVPNEIDDDGFWREFRRRCRSVNPEAYLVGEIWGPAERWLRGDQFDAVMNYPLTRAIFGLVASRLNDAEIARSGYAGITQLTGTRFARAVTGHLARHDWETNLAQLNLVGSHDTPRLKTVLCDDRQAVRMALLLLFTLPGAPCVYYGDELGLAGGHDPACRGTIPWDDEGVWDRDLRDYVQALAGLRASSRELRQGGFEIVHASEDLVLFERSCGDDVVLVAVNRSEKQHPVDLEPEGPVAVGLYRDPLGGLELESGDGRVRGLDLPARRAAVYFRH